MPNPEGYGSPYGLGTTAAAPSRVGGVLENPSTGEISGSRMINPVTRDYVVGANGRTSGMNDVQQLVHLAVSTDRGSAAVRSLGHTLRSIERITPNFISLVRAALEGAVQHLVDAGYIEVVDVTAEVVRPGTARARLLWRDLTSADPDTLQETSI